MPDSMEANCVLRLLCSSNGDMAISGPLDGSLYAETKVPYVDLGELEAPSGSVTTSATTKR